MTHAASKHLVRACTLAVAVALAWVPAAGTALAATHAGAVAGTHPASNDSAHFARRITIGPGGIQIDGRVNGEDDGHGGEIVRIGNGTVHISSDHDTIHGRHSVTVHGPVVVVDGESGLVRVFADAEVPAGERIEGDVVAVFGSVRVKGHVAGNVAAVFGSVELSPGAVVDGDVVALGGALDQQTGATVNGESVSLGLFSWRPGIPNLEQLLGALFCAWVLALVLGLLLMALFPRRTQRVARTAAERTGGSFMLGVASAPLVIIAIVLLLITVVGIPFALLLPLVYVFSVWSGQLTATYVLGCRLLRRPVGGGGTVAPLATGTLFVAMFFALGAILSGPEGPVRTIALFFTLLGVLLVLGLSVVGAGAVILSRFGTRPRDPDASLSGGVAAPPFAPPPPPAMAPPLPTAPAA